MRRNAWRRVRVVVLSVLGATPIQAAEIGFDQWYEFRYFEAGTFGTLCTPDACYPGENSVFAPSEPWTFTTPSDSFVKVLLTDGFPSGDSFSLFDFGSLIGSTPEVGISIGCGNDPDACFADPAMSHRAFVLSPGSHSLTVRADTAPFGTGAAFFQVQVIPEPSTVASLATALFAAAGLAWRQRRARQRRD